jgi:hypothetical protein
MKTEFNEDFEIKPLLNKTQIRINQVESTLEEFWGEIDMKLYPPEEVDR